MLDGQGCLIPVRHFNEDSPSMLSSLLSGPYAACCAEASAETNPNLNRNPHADHSQSDEVFSGSLVAEGGQECNLGELLDLNVSWSCHCSPAKADAAQEWGNIGVLAEEGAVCSISSDFNCSSTSPSRSAPVFPSSFVKEAGAGPAQSRSSNGDLEGDDTSHCLLAKADTRSSDLSRSVQEEGSYSNVSGGNGMHWEFAEAASSSVIRKEEGLSSSVGDGRDIGGKRTGCLCNGEDGNCADGRERSPGVEYSGMLQKISRDFENKEPLLGAVCASKNGMSSTESEEGCSETANAVEIFSMHSSLELLARQGGRSQCSGAKVCKKMRLLDCIEALHDTVSRDSTKERMVCNSVDDEQQPYLQGLDDESALRCLAFVPHSDLSRLSRVGKRYRDLVKSRQILKLRQDYGTVEHLVFFYASGQQGWTAYDAHRNVWRNLPPPYANRDFVSSDKESLSAGTHVLWFGKEVFEFVYYRYDLFTNSWDRGPSMINPRCLFASASCGGFAYVAGGFGPADNIGGLTLLNSAEKYNSLTGQWEQLPSMSTPRQKCAGFFMDGNFYVIGGRDANHQPIMSGEEYNPRTGDWRTIPNMYFAPEVHHRSMPDPCPPLVAVVNNQLYAVENTTNALKIYNKQNNTWTHLGLLPVPADLRNGWGVAFKALGDRLFVMGDLEGIAAFYWRPGPNAQGPNWQPLFFRHRGVNSFLYNCAVMTC